MAAYGQLESLPPIRRANPNTIQDKFLVGYQGWFTCGGDGPPVHNGHHGWLHWSNIPLPDGGHPTIDAWPDTSTYSPSELYPVPGLVMEDGSAACLFSSRHPKTVRRHFNWMAVHGVDGVFLQRFAGQLEVDGNHTGAKADLTRLRDEIGDRVREAAEAEGRVFAIMYDVSGVPADRIEKVIKVDWEHLIRDRGILDSPSYLREKGRPVIGLWGFGFDKAHHSPDVLRRIIRHLRSHTPGGAYIFAGTPTHWRLLRADSDPNPEWLNVWYGEVDAISPWAVGRFHNEETIARFWEEKVRPDMMAVAEENAKRGRHVDYVPVVLPGSSGWNLSGGKWAFNDAKRNGGKFLWRQIYNTKQAGARIVYGAMWDEYDEGTNFLPMVASKRLVPRSTLDRSFKFVSGDIDGFDLPPDWYMRIAGLLGEALRGQRDLEKDLPVKALWDYWRGRPRREIGAGPSTEIEPAALPQASGSHVQVEEVRSSSGHTTGYDTVALVEIGHDDEQPEVPPPPYSLVAEEAPSAPGPRPTVLSAGLDHGMHALALVTSPISTGEQSPPVRRSTRPSFQPHSISSLSQGSSSSTSSEYSVLPPPLPFASKPRTSVPIPGPRTDSPTLPPPQHPSRSRISTTPRVSSPGISGASARTGAVLAPPRHPSSQSRAASPARPSLPSHSSTSSSAATEDVSPVSVSVETVDGDEAEVSILAPRPSLDAIAPSRSNRNSGIYSPTYEPYPIPSPVPSPSPSPAPSPMIENADLEPNPYPFIIPQSPPPVPRKGHESRLSQSGLSMAAMPSPPLVPHASRPPSNYVPYNSRTSLHSPGSPQSPNSGASLGPYGMMPSPSSPGSPADNGPVFATAQSRPSNEWGAHGSVNGDDPRFHQMPQPHAAMSSGSGHNPGLGPSLAYAPYGSYAGYDPNQPQWPPQPFPPQQYPIQQPGFPPQSPPPTGYHPSYGVVQSQDEHQTEGPGERSIVDSISHAGSRFLNKLKRF